MPFRGPSGAALTAPAVRIVDTGYRPREWQRTVHEALRRFSVLVVHRRGGKTVLAVSTLVAAAVACTRERGRFGYVAPLLKQAREAAWDYLLYYTRPIPGVKVNESRLSVAFPNGAKITLFGADNPDALRGPYFDGVVPDEVADMRPNLWGEIIRPMLADRMGWALFIGTPKGLNLLSELYYRALRDPEWHAARLTCYETDALDADEIERAKREMTEAQFAQEMLCDFHASSENVLVALDVARAAAVRKLDPALYQHAPRVMGVDVARYGGDRSAIVRRQGVAMLRPFVGRNLDTMELAGRVAQEADEWLPTAIFVDVGGVGAGVVDRLRQLGHPALPVDFGSSPANPRFANKRAEIWWTMAEWLAHAAIPDDEALLAELCAPTFSYANARGRFELESKDALRKRGFPSPDIADALACTFAHPVALPGLGVGRCITERPGYDVLDP